MTTSVMFITSGSLHPFLLTVPLDLRAPEITSIEDSVIGCVLKITQQNDKIPSIGGGGDFLLLSCEITLW